jgi:thioredoxin 2
MVSVSALLSDDRGVIVACPSCGTRNRLAFDRLGRPSRCAKCHADIMLPSTPQEVDSSQQFDTLVARSALPILVDFWAPWCGPCRMVSPEVEKVAQRNSGRLLVVKVNTDVVSDVASRLRIQGIPTLAIFAEGREAGRKTGAISADRIDAFVRETIG